MLMKGTAFTDGMEVPGLGVIHPDVEGHDIITNNLIAINVDTVDKLADLGL
jgi:simple sugar transport system substrate-binding protein